MNWFKWKQWLLALCAVASVNVQGTTLDEWGENTPPREPIGLTMSEEEEETYFFRDWMSHVDYGEFRNGWSSTTHYKTIYLELPSEESEMVYIKASLKDPSQANTITFRINDTDLSFTDGVTWISPSECSQSGGTQSIPFRARITAANIYSYTFEAYADPKSTTPLAKWEGTFHYMENIPSITLPRNIHAGTFDIEVKKGDLSIPAYMSISIYSERDYGKMSLSAQGFTQDPNDDNRWVSAVKPLDDATITCQLSVEGKGVGNCSVELKDEKGNHIRSYGTTVLYPFNPSSSDVAALDSLATLNPNCKELVDFVQNRVWESNESNEEPNVRVDWSYGNPSYVTSLKIEYQEETLNLDLAGFKHLRDLHICYNKEISAPLDLSMLSELNYIYMWNDANLTYKDIIFPKEFDKSRISANSKIYNIGTPRDEWSVEVPINTVIDLTAYVGEPLEGSETTYRWERNGEEVQLTPIKEGTFKLHGEVKDRFYCEIQNDSFPNWRITTPTIYLTQGEIIFDEKEIEGIKKIAADNPHTTEFQEFVDAELWKEQTWENWEKNYPIQLKWAIDEENNGRLVGLKLSASGWDHYPTKVDLTAFPELQQFTTYDAERIDTFDVSKCTKLQKLEFYNNRVLTSLDLSACTQLKEIRLTGSVLQTLIEPIYTQLEVFELRAQVPTFDTSSKSTLKRLSLQGNDNFTTLDISQMPNLEEINLTGFHNLNSLNLSVLENLKNLYFDNCSDIASIVGLENLQLKRFKLYRSDFLSVEQLNNMDFSQLTYLSLENSHYGLPDASKLQNLEELNVPIELTELDMDSVPHLNSLYVYNSQLRYSGIKNYRQKSGWDENGHWQDGVYYGGNTWFDLPGSVEVKDEWYKCIYVGDTIDLSAEAVINGSPTTFIWIDDQYNTEEKSLFVPTDKPGVYVISENVPLNDERRYRCKIWNKAFARDVTVNSSSGWILEINTFKVLGGQQSAQGYDQRDVDALATIVYNSTNQGLKDWFNNGGWKENGSIDLGDDYGSVWIEWSDEETKRLTILSLSSMPEMLTGTVDVSALDRLEQLELSSTSVSAVQLPANSENLKRLNLENSKVISVDLTTCPNLTYLNLQNNAGLKNCDLSQNTQLVQLRLGGTTIALGENAYYSYLTEFMTADNIASINMDQMPQLQTLVIMNDQLKFSDVKNPHQLSDVSCKSNVRITDRIYHGINMIQQGEVIDLTDEMTVGDTPSTIQEPDLLIETELLGQYKVDWTQGKQPTLSIVNEMFPGWALYIPMQLFTEKGDVNTDEAVNVQDVTATASYLVEDGNQIADYSEYAADINENERVDVGDLVGIVNIIMNQPFTQSYGLRAAYRPTVTIQMDEKNFLTVENEVPVSALYMEIAGAHAEISLLSDAARLMQASSLKGDTLRIVAYSLDGRTIGSGKHIIAQLQPGMRVVKATFSDAQAMLLETTGNIQVTSNETVVSELETKTVYNYPNPTMGQTTFCYQLTEPVQSVELQFFAANGALAARLKGLPATAGSQHYSTTLPLGTGVYYYRLVIDGKHVSATNTLIIK